MIDDSFRQILPRYTDGLVRFYTKLRVTPNQITLLALFLASISTVLIAAGWFVLALVVWWLGRLLDGTDGIYARATDQASGFGAFLDILCDMAAYSIMLFGFAAAFPAFQTYWMIVLFFYVLCVTGALALGSIEREYNIEPRDNRGVRLAAGLAEGGETGIAYSLFLLFPVQIELWLKLWIAVLFITVVARTVLASRILRHSN